MRLFHFDFLKRGAVTAVVVCLFFAEAAGAASLWDDNANWFADDRPSRVGDIVTVLISEKTDAKDEAKMDLQKSSNSTVADGTGILKFIRGLTFSSSNTSAGDGSSSNTSAGDGSIERKHHATGKISCLVTEVLPNGNLVIEGTRDVSTSEEVLQFQLIGVIRPQDVNNDNQIKSELIANAELAVKGRGVVSRTQKPGLVTQILQAVF